MGLVLGPDELVLKFFVVQALTQSFECFKFLRCCLDVLIKMAFVVLSKVDVAEQLCYVLAPGFPHWTFLFRRHWDLESKILSVFQEIPETIDTNELAIAD
jgi:hypothetical protein